MARMVDCYRLVRMPRNVVVGGVRFTFEVVRDGPWWSFRSTKVVIPPEIVILASSTRGRASLEALIFERGFLADWDPKAKTAAEWLVRRGYAVKGTATV